MEKKPLALLVNDLHISKDNIEEFMLNWEEALSICLKRKIGHIVVGGDLFTSRSSQTLPVLTAIYESLRLAHERYDVYVTLIPGNHDRSNQEETNSYCHLYRQCPGVRVADEYEILLWPEYNLLLLAVSYFPENGSFTERFKRITADVLRKYSDTIRSKEDVILYLHEGIHGALGDFDIPGELPQELFKGYGAVLVGHFHNRTKIKGTNIEYIGASRQTSFGEDEEKGYTILYSDGSYEFVKNEVNKRYVTLEIDADQIGNYRPDDDERYLRKIKVRATEQQAKTIKRQDLLDMGFNKAEIIVESPNETQIKAEDLTQKYDKSGITQAYKGFCEENNIDNTLGLKYLEG